MNKVEPTRFGEHFNTPPTEPSKHYSLPKVSKTSNKVCDTSCAGATFTGGVNDSTPITCHAYIKQSVLRYNDWLDGAHRMERLCLTI